MMFQFTAYDDLSYDLFTPQGSTTGKTPSITILIDAIVFLVAGSAMFDVMDKKTLTKMVTELQEAKNGESEHQNKPR